MLRRSMRLDLEPNNEQASRLAQAWRFFFKGVNEQSMRNNSAALFLQQSDDVSSVLFRSTPKSRPNNTGQMSVRPQKVFPIPMKFGM